MKIGINNFLLLIGLLCFNLVVSAQISVDKTTYSVEKLIKEVLITGTIEISNIKFTGSAEAVGYFSGGDVSNFFLSGIVLATGDVENAIGPNSSGALHTAFGSGSDADLSKLVAGRYTTDAAVLEFDFVPQADSIQFYYIFGSEEYPEYVDAGYNDVFAFFLSGKNPAGGEYENMNIALIPETSIVVSIDNINHLRNTLFYQDNENGKSIEYDGFTKPLIAQAKVVKGQKYHIKIAICDVGDERYDSGVFLKATSFYGGSSLEYENTCYGAETNFTLSNPESIDSCKWDFDDKDSGDKNYSNLLNPTHIFSAPDTYEITIITYSGGIADTINQTITIEGKIINLGDDISLSEGQTIELDAGEGGSDYLWSSGETTQKITVNKDGKYAVKVTYPDGCIGEDEIIVQSKQCDCCLLALIFGILMTLTSLILFLICKKKYCDE